MRQFLDLYGPRGEGRPQQVAFVAQRSNALIEELEQKQADITATLAELKAIHGQCLSYLAEHGAPCGEEAPTDEGERALKRVRRSQSKG